VDVSSPATACADTDAASEQQSLNVTDWCLFISYRNTQITVQTSSGTHKPYNISKHYPINYTHHVYTRIPTSV